MTSYTQNNTHHFATRRNSTSSPYTIPARPRSNSITTSPYNIPERVQSNHNNQPVNGGGSHSYNPRFAYSPLNPLPNGSVTNNGNNVNNTNNNIAPAGPPSLSGTASAPPQATSVANGHPHRHSYSHGSGTQNGAHNSFKNSDKVPLLSREFVVRRISEGETGRVKQELKCEACGKGYKHISSLAKHLWEHTAEWNYTKKLLISKHQQVQLLEAASILVSMNENDKKKNGLSKDENEDRATPKPIGIAAATSNSGSGVTGASNGPLSPGQNSRFLQSPPQYNGNNSFNGASSSKQAFPASYYGNSLNMNIHPHSHRGSSSIPPESYINNGNNVIGNSGHGNPHDELMSPSKRFSFTNGQRPSVAQLTRPGSDAASNGGFLDTPVNANHLQPEYINAYRNGNENGNGFLKHSHHDNSSNNLAVVDDDDEEEEEAAAAAEQEEKAKKAAAQNEKLENNGVDKSELGDVNDHNKHSNGNRSESAEEEYEADEGVFGELE